MSQLKLFAGLRNRAGAIAQAETGYDDDGVIYNVLAVSERVFPGGIGGEAIFDAMYLVLTYATRFRLYVSAVVDGVIYSETLLDPGVAIASEKTTRYEVPLRTDMLNALGTVVGKRALRGGWIQIRIRSAFDAVYLPGAVRVDEARVEGEVVVESLTPLAGAGA